MTVFLLFLSMGRLRQLALHLQPGLHKINVWVKSVRVLHLNVQINVVKMCPQSVQTGWRSYHSRHHANRVTAIEGRYIVSFLSNDTQVNLISPSSIYTAWSRWDKRGGHAAVSHTGALPMEAEILGCVSVNNRKVITLDLKNWQSLSGQLHNWMFM